MSAEVAVPLDSEARAESVALEALLVSRCYLYTLFHKLFGGVPNEEMLDALFGNATADAVGEYAADDATMRGLENFLAGLASRKDRGALLEEARDEYTRLFVGPAALPALPYESPYRTKEATLFQENTLAVRAVYRTSGLEPKRLQRVPDDRVAIECAFMSVQAGKALRALRAGDCSGLAVELRRERDFVSRHMVGWLDDFAEAIRRSKTATLYPQMAEALAAFVRLDDTFLVEAAFWAEGLGGEGSESRSVIEGMGARAGSPEAAAIGAVEEALASLENIRPFGIEDNELVAVQVCADAK